MSDHAEHSGPGGHHAVDIDKHVKVYISVFVALMVLTIITVAISYLDLSVPMAVTIAMFVALIKGGLVAGYFMHLVSEKKLIYAVMLLTVAFFIVLMFVPLITHNNGFWIPEEHPVTAAPAPSQH
jgi:cytochrome c oxidase subunit 4